MADMTVFRFELMNVVSSKLAACRFKNITAKNKMKIAFDAKRAYQNNTGLGHYSRTLITSLVRSYPDHQYYLCAPKITGRFQATGFPNVSNITPSHVIDRKVSSFWRSFRLTNALTKEGIDLYHGLSHEIPVGIAQTTIRSVVTIHDLIFERFPGQYNWIDVRVYRRKFKYACENADQVIAISTQTKNDLVDFYNIPAEKISTCYQSCDAAFAQTVTAEMANRIKQKYGLPDRYFLYVGSVIERKNLLNICRAIKQLKEQLDLPLVVIGGGGKYKRMVQHYIAENGIKDRVIFLSESAGAKQSAGFSSSADFPAFYQLSEALIYPSFFEGFGIPVLEALWSRTPVITSNTSCLPEAGGDAAYYVDPSSSEQIAEAMLQVATDRSLREQMVQKGWNHAQNFTPEKCAAKVMQVYLRLK
jgi:glycosyltransferase involved in cell wall biosynthesis